MGWHNLDQVTVPARQELAADTKTMGAAPGIISCLAPSPDRSGLLAAGSYSGAAALFDEATGELLFLLAGHSGGVTQVPPCRTRRLRCFCCSR